MALPKIQHPFRWTLLAAAGALIFFGHWMWRNHQLNQAVADEVARIDRIDPDWTYEAIEAKQPVIADKDNGALLVLEIAAKMPGTGREWDNFQITTEPEDQTEEEKTKLRAKDELQAMNWDQPVRLSKEALDWFVAELDKTKEGFDLAQGLSKFVQGRYPIEYPPLWWRQGRDDVSAKWKVESLLTFQASGQLQLNKPEEVCRTSLLMIALGRSIGDDLSQMAQLNRAALILKAQSAVENALSIGQVPSAILQSLQDSFHQEAKALGPLLFQAARAERALYHRMFEGFWDRIIFLDDLSDLHWQPKFSLRSLRHQHVAYLREATIELDRWKNGWDPVKEKPPRIKWCGTCDPRANGDKWYTDLVVVISWNKFVQVRSEARLHATIAALAAERFRLENKRWPHTLEELTPRFLKEVPLDPYTKASLRLARHEGKLVVYSVGPDGKDDGGEVRDPNNPQADGSDVGFTLLDPERRGLLPAK